MKYVYPPLVSHPDDSALLVQRFRTAPDVVTYFADNPDAVLDIPVVWCVNGRIEAWTQRITRTTSSVVDRHTVIDTGVVGRIVDAAYGVTPPDVNVWLNPALSHPNVTIQQARVNDTYQTIFASPSGCDMVDFNTIPGLAELPIYPTLGALGWSSYGDRPNWPYMITGINSHSYYRQYRTRLHVNATSEETVVADITTPEIWEDHRPILQLAELLSHVSIPRGSFVHFGLPRYAGALVQESDCWYLTEYGGNGNVIRDTSSEWRGIGMWLNNTVGNFVVRLSHETVVVGNCLTDDTWYDGYTANNYYDIYASPLIVERFYNPPVSGGVGGVTQLIAIGLAGWLGSTLPNAVPSLTIWLAHNCRRGGL